MHTWSTSLPCWGLWVVYTCAWGLVWVCGVLLCLSATIGCCCGCKSAWVSHCYLGFWLVIPLSPVAWVTMVSLYWLLSITMFYILLLLLFLVKFLLFSPFLPLWSFRLCLPFSFPLPWCGWRFVSVGLGLGRRSAFYSQCCRQLVVVSGTLLILRENHHASVVWNWYHWVAIAYLYQPSTDSADVKSRLQRSDTSSIPPINVVFFLCRE